MQIKIKVCEFLEVLNKIKHIAKPDKTCPVLSNGMFETTDSGIRITVANLISTAVVNTAAEIIESGKCLIDLCKLSAILATLSGDVTIEEKDAVIWIKKDKTKCKLEKTKLSDYPQDLYKLNNPDAEFMITAASLREGIKKTEKFSEKSSNILSGINIKTDGNLVKFSACDGNRLAYIIKCCESSDIFVDITISEASANSLLPFLPNDGDVNIKVSAALCEFEFDNIRFCTRLLEGVFPKIEQLLPKSHTTKLSVNKDELKKVLERIEVVETKADKCAVMFTVKGAFMTVEASEYKCNNVLTLEEKEGEDISFKLNRCFLQAVLSSISGTFVKFELTGPRSPVLFPDMEDKFLIMPIA